MKNRTGSIFAGLLAGSVVLFSVICGSVAEERPNLILFLVDDMGYGDIGPFGATTQRTPNLDRLADEGMCLTDFYAAPLCSPARASLMTGCYPPRAGVPKVFFPADPNGLNPDEITLPELLKKQGYATACIGKWHLGDAPEFLPTRQGFDLYYGLPYSNDMAVEADGGKDHYAAWRAPCRIAPYPPLPLLRNEEVVKAVRRKDQEALVGDYTKEAVRFIHDSEEQPFFLYLAHAAVHIPYHPSEAFQGRTGNGLLADWVEEIDWSVGEIMAALRAEGVADKTLVLFTSDNGAPFPWSGRTQKGGSNLPLRDRKGTVYEGGLRVPAIAWYPDRVPAGTRNSAIAALMDVLPTFVHLAGGTVPQDRLIDGRDLWPLLSGKSSGCVHDVFYYYRDRYLCGVRSGDWKLLLKDCSGKLKTVPELYNLAEDIGEKNNVAADHPAVVARLQKQMDAAREDIGDGAAGPGCRPPGFVENPVTLIPSDYKRNDFLGQMTAPKGTVFNDLRWLADQPRLVTGPVQKAINRCAEKGGGVVLFGPGTYGIGAVHLRDGVVLQLDEKTVLLGSPFPDHYLRQSGASYGGLICADGVKNFAIKGGGVINGNICVFDDPGAGGQVAGKPSCLLQFRNCRDFSVEDVHLTEYPSLPIELSGCTNGKIQNVNVSSQSTREPVNP